MSVILAAILLVDVVEQLRTVGGSTEISLLTAVQLSLMKMPMLLEQTMPFVILVSAILAYSRLSRLSELPAMRAAGLSAWRFLAPLAALALFLGLFVVFVLNPLGARLNSDFETTRARLLDKQVDGIAPAKNGIWLRQGNDTGQFVINAKSAEQSGVVLNNVKIFEYERIYTRNQGTDDFAFKNRIEARTATLKNGFWELKDVVENTPGLEPVRRAALSIPTDLDPAKLLDRFASPSTIGFWKLPAFIKETRLAGLDASRYEMHYQALLAAPILYVAMALIGALVCLRLASLGGTAASDRVGFVFGCDAVLRHRTISQSRSRWCCFLCLWRPAHRLLFALFAALTAIAYLEDG